SSALNQKAGKFYNEALLDFAVPANREKMDRALKDLGRRLPVQVPVVIQNKELTSTKLFSRINPSHSEQVVGTISMATTEQAEAAMQAAQSAYSTWKKVPAEQRAALVDKLADLMLRDRFELIATQVYEVGKSWAEADGDVGEAIDFCRYYARHMRELQKPQRVGGVPGEISQYIYKSRGVTAVIAPWNFPLAILTGMVAAAAVTGNTVVMKPAEQSSVVAWGLMKMIREAGFPAGVINFLPGFGEEVGEFIVNHKFTTTIAFTGSKNVGLHILHRASQVQAGQQHVKRCIIEMGGKNAVIVDNDADLDEAVDGVLYSAFGFSGQKCSAASRVIVLDEVYERFADRLVEAARSMEVLPAENPKTALGPVVDQEAYDRILGTLREAEGRHKLLFKGAVPGGGFFIPPSIFGEVPADSDLAQKEIFGPVVAMIRARDLDHALEIANSTEYALTGGLFSRSPANIARIKEEFEVGNLYINRGITGAMVDRHPFGGFKMSGIGSKTGGPDYLKQYVEPACVTENTLRRGFAPAEEI
ncbi:MAG: L-glutamate gamma-semialdehyde dehydrogenase, partial [Bdellovibrio sp.]